MKPGYFTVPTSCIYCNAQEFGLINTGRKTWQQSYDNAIASGGRLPSLSEAAGMIEKYGAQGNRGDNVLVPVGDPSNKDWMWISYYYPSG